jgi:AraC family transcriptional regulator
MIKKGVAMEPRIVELPMINLVGLPYYGNAENGAFGQVWDRLMKIEQPIPNRINEKVAYGLEVYGPEFMQANQWMYFASVEVSDFDELPGVLFAKSLPAATYAVFHVTGKLAKIGEMFHYAYMEWLPASHYQVAYPFDFEYYGEQFQGDVDASEMDLYIPVRLK